MLYLLILIGSIAFAIRETLNVKYVRDGNHGAGGWSSTFVLGGSMLTTSFYLLILWLVLWYLGFIVFPVNSLFWFALAVTVLINIAFEVVRFKAYGLADFALISPFAGISPVLTILTSWLIINELPTIGGALGIILIAVSIYFLHLKEKLAWKNVLKPFKAVWSNRGVRYGFLAAIPPAVSIVFDKKAVVAADPISYAVFAVFFIGAGAWAVDLFSQGRIKFIRQINFQRLRRFGFISFFHFINAAAFSAALLFDIVPNVSALRRLVIVFEVILGYFILKQKTDIKKRLIASAGVVAGCVLIAIFG